MQQVWDTWALVAHDTRTIPQQSNEGVDGDGSNRRWLDNVISLAKQDRGDLRNSVIPVVHVIFHQAVITSLYVRQ